MTIALCMMLSSWIWLGCAGKATPAKKGDMAVPVTVAAVTRKDVPVDIQVVGNVEAYLTITIKPQAGGELTGVHFREGDFVKKGDLLFTIDPRLLQAQLNQVEANLARDEAQLGQIEANLARDVAQEKYAHAQAVRYASLLQNGLISKEEAEQVRTNAEASSAAVHADQAALRSAHAAVVASKAAVENVRVQLGYTSIRSPIDGRTGNQNVKQGNVVTANLTDLVTINQIQPIYVAFSVPEARRPEIKKSQLVMVSPQGDSSTLETGEVSFVDNTVDSTTGTIRVKGTITNKERKLWPGEFARVSVRLATQTNALVVPNQAVQTGQEGSYVYVVKEDHKVESRPVTTGTRVDQDLVVEKGLKPGETVVTEGQLRLAPGIRVQITNAEGGSPKGKSKTKTGVEP
ncbi:MAG TPA: efflux RND transporter periplasmic adaptor subunit [Tepidisphaeraceae bacterium]|nr:efflux RND transporter periplasmic adaptor subunit [Tepidisphaeraceae bacterium]